MQKGCKGRVADSHGMVRAADKRTSDAGPSSQKQWLTMAPATASPAKLQAVVSG